MSLRLQSRHTTWSFCLVLLEICSCWTNTNCIADEDGSISAVGRLQAGRARRAGDVISGLRNNSMKNVSNAHVFVPFLQFGSFTNSPHQWTQLPTGMGKMWKPCVSSKTSETRLHIFLNFCSYNTTVQCTTPRKASTALQCISSKMPTLN